MKWGEQEEIIAFARGAAVVLMLQKSSSIFFEKNREETCKQTLSFDYSASSLCTGIVGKREIRKSSDRFQIPYSAPATDAATDRKFCIVLQVQLVGIQKNSVIFSLFFNWRQ